ncbi:MAG: hypothetical protein HYZ72_07265 [Deltaproteobacteria bacterium]|nr:hypothetical protein [Deltaproteobacteria bacterium]
MAAGKALPLPRMQAGDQYGRLTLLVRSGTGKRHLWQCRCTCGKVVTVWENNLRTGRTRSCGCLRKEWLRKASTKHGETAGDRTTPEYRAWQNLRRRQLVCQRWRVSFAVFLAAVGRRPSAQHILTHTKSGSAGPRTVAWLLRQEVLRARFARRIRVGRESHTVREWAHMVGLSHATLYNRLAKDWSAKRAIFTPASPGGRPPRVSANRPTATTAKK